MKQAIKSNNALLNPKIQIKNSAILMSHGNRHPVLQCSKAGPALAVQVSCAALESLLA